MTQCVMRLAENGGRGGAGGGCSLAISLNGGGRGYFSLAPGGGLS